MQMKKYSYETFYELSKTKEYNKLFMIHLGKATTSYADSILSVYTQKYHILYSHLYILVCFYFSMDNDYCCYVLGEYTHCIRPSKRTVSMLKKNIWSWKNVKESVLTTVHQIFSLDNVTV